MKNAKIEVKSLTVGQTFTLMGKCLIRLYSEYEQPILYAALAGTWTLIFVHHFSK